MSQWKDRERDHWRFKFQYRGQTHTGRGYATRREAATAEEAERKKARAESKQTHRGMGFREAASIYLDYSERRHAKITYKYKRFVYRKFQEMHGNIPIEQITTWHVQEYLLTRPSNYNYNFHRKDLSALFNYLKSSLKMNIHNPCIDVGKMPHTAGVKEIPSEEEIVKLILAADPQTDEQDLILCILHTIGRVDELLRLTWQDVNFERRMVTLWTRKRKDGAYEPDDIPINQDLYDALKRRWAGRTQEKWVFVNEGTGDRYRRRPRMMKSLCKRAGIQHYGFHCLRHFMSSYLADKEKISLKAISGLLRHKSLKTTEIYLHSIDESAREAMTRVEGKFTSNPSESHPGPSPTKEEGKASDTQHPE